VRAITARVLAAMLGSNSSTDQKILPQRALGWMSSLDNPVLTRFRSEIVTITRRRVLARHSIH
jgi:hypothetical protein